MDAASRTVASLPGIASRRVISWRSIGQRGAVAPRRLKWRGQPPTESRVRRRGPRAEVAVD
eukprot:14316395-Alexandrium_andersonii.AAC.1